MKTENLEEWLKAMGEYRINAILIYENHDNVSQKTNQNKVVWKKNKVSFAKRALFKATCNNLL